MMNAFSSRSRSRANDAMSASTIGIDKPRYPIPTPATIPEIKGRTAMTTRADKKPDIDRHIATDVRPRV